MHESIRIQYRIEKMIAARRKIKKSNGNNKNKIENVLDWFLIGDMADRHNLNNKNKINIKIETSKESE